MDGKKFLDLLTKLDEDIIEGSERYKSDEKLIADSKRQRNYKAAGVFSIGLALCIALISIIVIKNVTVFESDDGKASVGKEAANAGKNKGNNVHKPDDKKGTDTEDNANKKEIAFSFKSNGYKDVCEKLERLKEKAVRSKNEVYGERYILYDDLIECLGEPNIRYERIKGTNGGTDSSDNGARSAYKWLLDDGFYISAENGVIATSLDIEPNYFGIGSGCNIDGVEISGDFEKVAKDEEGFAELEDMISRILNRKSFEDAPYFRETKIDTMLWNSRPNMACRIINTDRFSVEREIDPDITLGSFYYRYPNDEIRNLDMIGGSIVIDGAGDYRGMDWRYVMEMFNSIYNTKSFNEVKEIIGEPDRIEDLNGIEIYCYTIGKFTLKAYEEKTGIVRDLIFNEDEVLYSRGVMEKKNSFNPEETKPVIKPEEKKELTEQDKKYAEFIKEDLKKLVTDEEFKQKVYSELDKYLSEHRKKIYNSLPYYPYLSVNIKWVGPPDYIDGYTSLISMFEDKGDKDNYLPYILSYVIENNMTGLDGGYIIFCLNNMTRDYNTDDNDENNKSDNDYDTVFEIAFQWWTGVREEILDHRIQNDNTYSILVKHGIPVTEVCSLDDYIYINIISSPDNRSELNNYIKIEKILACEDNDRKYKHVSIRYYDTDGKFIQEYVKRSLPRLNRKEVKIIDESTKEVLAKAIEDL